jgi:hypothetical protein
MDNRQRVFISGYYPKLKAIGYYGEGFVTSKDDAWSRTILFGQFPEQNDHCSDKMEEAKQEFPEVDWSFETAALTER